MRHFLQLRRCCYYRKQGPIPAIRIRVTSAPTSVSSHSVAAAVKFPKKFRTLVWMNRWIGAKVLNVLRKGKIFVEGRPSLERGFCDDSLFDKHLIRAPNDSTHFHYLQSHQTRADDDDHGSTTGQSACLPWLIRMTMISVKKWWMSLLLPTKFDRDDDNHNKRQGFVLFSQRQQRQVKKPAQFKRINKTQAPWNSVADSAARKMAKCVG